MDHPPDKPISHMAVLIIRQFFTFKLRTRNPAYLFVLGIVGMLLLLPLLLVLMDATPTVQMTTGIWIWLWGLALAGIIALVNLVINLIVPA